MPGFDKSGPMGNGPMTGGARGLCGSAARRQIGADAESGFFRGGLGCRRGFGGRRGGEFGRGGGVPFEPGSATKQDSRRETLEANVRDMQHTLERLQRRIDEL